MVEQGLEIIQLISNLSFAWALCQTRVQTTRLHLRHVFFFFFWQDRMTFHLSNRGKRGNSVSLKTFLINLSLFLSLCQVKSEYEQLQEALYTVTVERDCALLERTELQGKLENLEQVLKVRTSQCKSHNQKKNKL